MTPHGRAVRGTVLDETGKPATCASVVVSQIRSDWPQEFPTRPCRPLERPRGQYEVSGLFDGEWSVAAEAPGYAQSSPRTFTIPGDGSPIDISRSGTHASGEVVDASGRPVAERKRVGGVEDGGGSHYRFHCGGFGNASDANGRSARFGSSGNVMLSRRLTKTCGLPRCQPGGSRLESDCSSPTASAAAEIAELRTSSPTPRSRRRGRVRSRRGGPACRAASSRRGRPPRSHSRLRGTSSPPRAP